MIKRHSRTHCVLKGIIVSALLMLALFVFIMMPRGSSIAVKSFDPLFEVLEDGDIILRLGNRFWSQVFRDMSLEDRRFSHLGIIRVYNGHITVIHAEGTAAAGEDFVREDSLEDFLSIARSIGIYRAKGIDGSKISNMALEYIGIPFDWQFDMQDESRIYCTELLYLILKRLEPALELSTQYIRMLGTYIIPIDAISTSEHFLEIYFRQ